MDRYIRVDQRKGEQQSIQDNEVGFTFDVGPVVGQDTR